jgi:hypothetical protein
MGEHSVPGDIFCIAFHKNKGAPFIPDKHPGT